MCCSGSTDGPTRVIALVGLSIFSDTGAVLDAILKAADSSSVSPLVREVKGCRPRQVCLLHDSCGHIVMVVAGQRGVGVILCLEAALHLPEAGLPRGRRVRGREGTTRQVVAHIGHGGVTWVVVLHCWVVQVADLVILVLNVAHGEESCINQVGGSGCC